MGMDYKEINHLLRRLSGLSKESSFYSDNKLLLPLLQHKKSRIRWCVADHFGKVKYQRAVNDLVNALDDPCWRVRLHSAKALGRIQDHSSIDALISHRKDECSYVRRRVISALGYFDQNHNIIPYLIDALIWDEDHEVKKRASEALLHFERTGAMIVFMENPNHLYDEFDFFRDVYAAFQDSGSGTISQQQLMDILVAHRKDKCPYVRKRIVSVFGHLNQNRDIITSYLIDTFLWDKDRKVRSRAFATLAGFRQSGLVILSALMENPENFNNDPDFPRYVHTAFRNVETISKYQLIKFLSTGDDIIRNQAIQTFLKFPSKEIQQAVRKILDNPIERENMARDGLQKMEVITKKYIAKSMGYESISRWVTHFNYTTYFRYPVYFTSVDFASKIYLDEVTSRSKSSTSSIDSLKRTKRILERKKNELAIDEIRDWLIGGLFGIGLIVLVVTGGGITSFFSRMSKIDSFSAFLEFLYIFFMLFFMIGFSVLVGVVGVSFLLQRRNWFQKASRTQGIVVDKAFIYSEDQYGRVRGNYHQLILNLTEVGNVKQLVKIRVNKRIYKKFAQGDNVRVYYSNTNPLEILVEGE